VDIPAFLDALRRIGYTGPLVVERAVGAQTARLRDIADGLALLRTCLAG
jgi:sugar phosphate isomerase/epimerase